MTDETTPALADQVFEDANRAAVLRLLGLDPRKPEAHALLLIADRYDLDPLLREVELVATRGVLRPYISRAGMLKIAHRSGFLDGIVTDELRRNSTADGWTAYVSVWRKDCAHPFRMGAQCKDDERQSKEGYGPEQALARATRRALVLAFAISADGDEDAAYVEPIVSAETRVREVHAPGGAEVAEPGPDNAEFSGPGLVIDGREASDHGFDDDPTRPFL